VRSKQPTPSGWPEWEVMRCGRIKVSCSDEGNDAGCGDATKKCVVHETAMVKPAQGHLSSVEGCNGSDPSAKASSIADQTESTGRSTSGNRSARSDYSTCRRNI